MAHYFYKYENEDASTRVSGVWSIPFFCIKLKAIRGFMHEARKTAGEDVVFTEIRRI